MANEYYKSLLCEYINSAEFDEKIGKHCMSAEETQKAVENDDRGDSISRFLISKESVKKTLLGMVDHNLSAWFEMCSEVNEGEYIKYSKNFPVKVVVGIQHKKNGEEECKNLFLKLSYYKNPKNSAWDRMKVVTFYPSPKAVKIHE